MENIDTAQMTNDHLFMLMTLIEFYFKNIGKHINVSSLRRHCGNFLQRTGKIETIYNFRAATWPWVINHFTFAYA